MWPEFRDKKGVNEVISCLDYYMKNILPENVNEFHLSTDACPR